MGTDAAVPARPKPWSSCHRPGSGSAAAFWPDSGLIPTPADGGPAADGFAVDGTEGILFALAHAVEQRDRQTSGHCERLAFMAVALGMATQRNSRPHLDGEAVFGHGRDRFPSEPDYGRQSRVDWTPLNQWNTEILPNRRHTEAGAILRRPQSCSTPPGLPGSALEIREAAHARRCWRRRWTIPRAPPCRPSRNSRPRDVKPHCTGGLQLTVRSSVTISPTEKFPSPCRLMVDSSRLTRQTPPSG